MTSDEKILLERIKSLLERQEKRSREKPEQHWVSAKFIQKITGWNGRDLSDARDQGIVKYDKNERGGIMYLVESLPWQFIKHQPAEVSGEAPVISIRTA